MLDYSRTLDTVELSIGDLKIIADNLKPGVKDYIPNSRRLAQLADELKSRVKSFADNAHQYMVSAVELAINTKHRLEIEYDGLARIVDPHTLGRTSDDTYAVRVWQLPQGEEEGGWKLMKFDRIQNLTVSSVAFDGAAKGYKRGDRVMIFGIVAEL